MKQGTSGTYGSESLPNITGSTNWFVKVSNTSTNPANTGFGALKFGSSSTKTGASGSATYEAPITFDASLSNSIYQNDAKVNPDNAEILYVIKF